MARSLRRTSALAATLLLALSACGGGGDEQSAPAGSGAERGSDAAEGEAEPGGVECAVAGEDHPIVQALHGVEGDTVEAWVDAETGIGYLHAPDDHVQAGVIRLENGNSLEISLQANPKRSAPGTIEKVQTKEYLNEHMETLLASAKGWDTHFSEYDEENSSH